MKESLSRLVPKPASRNRTVVAAEAQFPKPLPLRLDASLSGRVKHGAMRLALAALAALLALAPARGLAARPAWIEQAIVYGVAPALAGPHGLADVTAHIAGIAELGATVLWLSPVTEAPDGDFGYAVTDPYHLRESLGTEADLHRLVRMAHAHGLKVILDLPLNDLSDRSRFYEDAERRGTASPYYGFFERDATGAATHYLDRTNLENLNYANPAVRDYVTAASTYWLRGFDIDGFRLDAAWGPRRRTPDFWPGWISTMRRIKPDIMLLAEASERDPYYAKAGFDAAYDWTDKLGERPWHDAFGGAEAASQLRAALAAENDSSPIFRCLDDNDSGRRFISRYGEATTRLAAALIMTLPGIPCLYMGDESGTAFDPYRAKAPIAWDQQGALRAYFHRLIALRHRHKALTAAALVLLGEGDAVDVLAYLRPGERPGESVLVMLNFGEAPASVSLAKDERLAALRHEKLEDLLTGEPIAPEPEIALPPLSARILAQAPGR